ncbi:MAG: type II toxin-antitoxin system RelE/ParE family toxin [Proteobacteria bacterium]|nr:type II toxin-antitoxin system RelE/ParE family toxin [Pseudomonadota bacterium]MBI3496202.1 type II toxin-antitoxin system RelE/ParE family toxin [Pseudomonadota bacterium]
MWAVHVAPEFEPELHRLSAAVRIELLAQARLLERFGLLAGRPRVDTLNGSKHANMKELRFDADGGVWRAAFAFDPERRAILLVAGDKSGRSEKAFYRRLIAFADKRFDAHLRRMQALRTRK